MGKLRADPAKDEQLYLDTKINEMRQMLRRGGLTSIEEEYLKRQIDNSKTQLRVLQGKMKWAVN